MFRLLMFLLFFGCVLSSQAQIIVQADNPDIDTLQVVFYKDKWAVEHRVDKGDNLFLLSRKYHVPPALLADMNETNFQATLNEGSIIYIPVGPYNQAKSEPGNRFDVRPLYYQVRKYDNLFRLAHLAGVPQRKLQEWNAMPDNYIEEGKRLFVGWILFNTSNAPIADTVSVTDNSRQRAGKNVSAVNDKGQVKPGSEVTVITLRKGKKIDTIPEIEQKYRSQTNNEEIVSEEKGTAVFYEDKGKLGGTNTYFAFHNTAKPGTIIKVYNPGTDKTIFVKVLGPIPTTKMYHNSVIGISDGAKDALLVTEEKAWCELKYAPSN